MSDVKESKFGNGPRVKPEPIETPFGKGTVYVGENAISVIVPNGVLSEWQSTEHKISKDQQERIALMELDMAKKATMFAGELVCTHKRSVTVNCGRGDDTHTYGVAMTKTNKDPKTGEPQLDYGMAYRAIKRKLPTELRTEIQPELSAKVRAAVEADLSKMDRKKD